VLAELVLPNGQSYKFSYNLYAEIDKVIYPSGGYERYRYAAIQASDWIRQFYEQANRGVVERWVSPKGDGSDEQRWQYSAGYADQNYSLPYKVTINAPDGSRAERYLYTAAQEYPWGFRDVRAGRAYEERIYSASNQMLRRTLTEWSGSVQSSSAGDYANARDPRITKQIGIILDTVGNALSRATINTYDGDNNLTSTARYPYVSIDQGTAQTANISSFATGTLLKTEETTYLVNDPLIDSSTQAAYRARNMVALPTWTKTRDGLGNILAQTNLKYDETTYPLLSIGSSSNWTDPVTNWRGNATTTKVWRDTTNYIQTHAQFDQFGNLRNSWDANAKLSQIDYSSAYQYTYPTTLTSAVPDPTGQSGSSSPLVTTSVFDFNTGNPTSTTDANNQTTSYAYNDPLNRVKTISLPDGGLRTYNYGDTPGNIYIETLTKQDATRNVDAYQYLDGMGRPTRSFLNLGNANFNTTDTEYDNMGRAFRVSNPYFSSGPGSAVNPSGLWTTSAFDGLGQVISVTTPDTAAVTTSYSGNTVTVTDQAGKKRRSLTDALGRLIRVDEPDINGNLDDQNGAPLQSTYYSYDVLDNLTQVSQGVQTRTFVYDSLKRLISATNPESGTISYQYDNNGNLTQKTDARGVITTFAYDALNRPTTRSYSDGTPTVTYKYDSATYGRGRLASVSSSVSTTNYTAYDALGRVKSANQVTDGQTYATSYDYNLAGNRTSMTYPSGRVLTIEYDQASRVAGMRDQQSGVYYAGASATDTSNLIQYAAHGAVSIMRLGNGLWEHTNFNNRLQPLEIGLGTASTNSSKLQLSYNYGGTNNNGNVQSITSVNGVTVTQTFGYDALNRLTTSTENNGSSWSQTNAYDRYGNRWIDFGGGNESLYFNSANNRITNSGYTYDNAGNLTSDGVHTCGFDAENKITSVDGVSDVYRYDGDGNRVRKNFPQGEQVRMVYSAGQLIAEYNLSGSLKTEYVHAPAGLLITINPWARIPKVTQYLIADHLGSLRVMTDSSGAIVSRHDYKPFGEELSAGVGGRTTAMGFVNDGVRQKFTQKERDNETGLDYFGARYMSSTQGRFTGVDLINLTKYHIANPQRWNGYTYAINNPLVTIDLDGKFPWTFYIRSFIYTSTFGAGLYKGDGRTPSTSDQVTSRVKFDFTLDIDRSQITSSHVSSDPSTYIGPGGPITKTGTPGSRISAVETFANNQKVTEAHYWGKDPLPGIVTPNLDVHAKFAVTENTAKGVLSINGRITGDTFPSTEAFVQDQSGKRVFLGANLEEGGVADLYGDNKENLFEINMQIRFDKKGNFTAVVVDGKTYSTEEWNKRVQARF
jgi:RHS repeat-associated protein